MARRKPFPPTWCLGGAGYEEIVCRFPGSVAEALQHAGISDPSGTGVVPSFNPACRVDEQAYAWVAKRAWMLRNAVSLEGMEGQRLYIEIQGLCGNGILYVEEQIVARFDHQEGEMLQVEVTELLLNEMEELRVAIRFAPAQDGAEGRRLPGIRGGMWLHAVRKGMISALQVHTDWYNSALVATCKVMPFEPGAYTFHYAVSYGAAPVGTVSFTEDIGEMPATVVHKLGIDGARAWEPGSPNALYDVKLTLLKRSVGCDVAHRHVGMLELDVERIWPNFPACVRGIHGHPLHVRGTTWAAPAWTPYESTWLEAQFAALEYARIQCLYVLTVQEEGFYDLCDRRGMLVWQALPLEEAEAAACVRRLAHHPCVLQWGIDAESLEKDGPQDEAAMEERAAEALRMLGEERPFLGMTPGGETPYPAWKDLSQRQCFNVAGPLWYPGPEMMARYGNDDDALIRVTRCAALQAPHSLCDAYGNPLLWPRNGALWGRRGGVFTYLEQEEAACFFGRGVGKTMEQASLLGRYIQAEMLRYLALRARWRGAAGFFAGSAGQVEDPFASDALIERDGSLRPAYHALRDAYAPVHACAVLDRFAFWLGAPLEAAIQLMVAPQAEAERKLTVTAGLYRFDGEMLAEDIWQTACQKAVVGTMRAALPEEECVLLLRIEVYEEGVRLDREDTHLCVGVHALQAGLTYAPRTTLRLAEGRLSNIGATLALGVACDGYTLESVPGWGVLLPGESHEVRQDASVEGINVQLERAVADEACEEAIESSGERPVTEITEDVPPQKDALEEGVRVQGEAAAPVTEASPWAVNAAPDTGPLHPFEDDW